MKTDNPNYKQILSKLSSLSVKELTNLKNRCTLLIQIQGKNHKVETLEDKDWILEGILAVSERTGLGAPHIIQIKNNKSFGSFTKKSLNVREYIEQFMPEDFTHLEYLKLGDICAQELLTYMTSWSNHSYVVSFSKMMFHVQEIPAALNAGFPGYLADGMLSVVVRHKFPN